MILILVKGEKYLVFQIKLRIIYFFRYVKYSNKNLEGDFIFYFVLQWGFYFVCVYYVRDILYYFGVKYYFFIFKLYSFKSLGMF